ncbi:DedA family protein [Betaproteobacteria bacterium SCN2]|jgi:membrane protein DedA with SNARE-associated domain|nr:DedA family protein [Betaproteobacteria bacterium SCN2]
MLHQFIDWILATVHDWGYLGIFILMGLESTVLPVPSEAVLIPAGYLAHQGKMSFELIVLASTFGSLAGATLNYVFALWVGRPFLERWGRYFFVRPELLHKTDAFFEKHGAISTFTGRLIPGIRHLISLPAGLTRMHYGKFAFYTCLGAGIWSIILTAMGWYIGGNEDLIRQYLKQITVGLILLIGAGIALYWWWQRKS